MVTLRLEAALMEIYKGLDALEAAVPLTRTEIAVELFRGDSPDVKMMQYPLAHDSQSAICCIIMGAPC